MYKEIKKMEFGQALRFGINAFLVALPFLVFFTLVKIYVN